MIYPIIRAFCVIFGLSAAKMLQILGIHLTIVPQQADAHASIFKASRTFSAVLSARERRSMSSRRSATISPRRIPVCGAIIRNVLALAFCTRSNSNWLSCGVKASLSRVFLPVGFIIIGMLQSRVFLSKLCSCAVFSGGGTALPAHLRHDGKHTAPTDMSLSRCILLPQSLRQSEMLRERIGEGYCSLCQNPHPPIDCIVF